MRRCGWLAALCLLAFGLSWGYIAYYLRGGPRIIDATSYFLEAKTLAHGAFTFPALEPSASFRGRFLLSSPDGQRLGVIFPPGYPALLALGFWIQAPLLIGPLLGAALVGATYFVARAVTRDTKVAWLAAALSAVCAALRYHTADTMSHGLATLLACLALGFALRRDLRLAALGCGLCLGWLAATRPISAGVAAVLCALALRGAPRRAWLELAAGTLPGIALLLLHQHALTGHWLDSTQLAYYAASDGPPGCFRYGFGSGIGCRFEHGDFVARYLPNGYGLAAATRNFFVHLGLFATDATNAWPLTLLAGYATFKHFRTPARLLALGVLLQALAYVPFYFDGNYPGGGARFLCEAIPLCQILVARAALDLRIGAWAVPAALCGFLLYGRHGHEQLRDREGGRPMFEPQLVAGLRGLVLVDTDHGFNLGHDPSARDAQRGLVVARARGDAHDRALYERLGAPTTYRYRYDLTGRQPPALVRHTPPTGAPLEAEAEWPALLDRGGAYPVHYPCASGGRGLRLLPGASLRLPLAAIAGPLQLGWVGTRPGRTELEVSWPGQPPVHLSAKGPGCSSLELPDPAPAPSELRVELLEGEGLLDYVRSAPAPDPKRP